MAFIYNHSLYTTIALRKPESVDHGRVANAQPKIISDYFDVLKTMLEENGFQNKPHLVFNCDEAAVFLNKSSKRVIVPRQSKHCHMLAQGTSQHITVLGCVSAAGATVPPLMVFTKGMPSIRAMKEDGPINETFSSTDSGFIDGDIYFEWFVKNFIRFAPPERPLLLLQDGASAHITVQLIDKAIEENIIILCFPPKLTHILQPLDVVIYRTLKA